MHCYPVVLVSANSKEAAIGRVTGWIDSQFESYGQSIYDYGGPIEENRCENTEDACRPASEVIDNIKNRVEQEKDVLRQHWTILKAYVEAFKDQDIPPMSFFSEKENAHRFKVTYKLAIGISPLIESGAEMKEKDMAAWQGIYSARRLGHMNDHIEESREFFKTTEALLYTIDTESQEALESGEWNGVWAVLCDFHF
jgi:hypothetical protein